MLDYLGAGLASTSPKFDASRLGFQSLDGVDREKAAEKLFEARKEAHPLGTVGRSRLLLRIIENSTPTSRLSEEYFRNTEHLLRLKPRLSIPGKVLLGLGSGRCGSTSLAALLATVSNSCCTHENPPLIAWIPNEVEIQFHIRRFELLADYYSVVADVSHWWLNVLDRFFRHFPDARAVGLFRDPEECARSFIKIKGHGRDSLNHWAPSGNNVWLPNVWDRTYPDYPVPDYSKSKPDHAKFEMITRYVIDYNTRLRAEIVRRPDRMRMIATTDLSNPTVQATILGLVGASARPFKRKLNVKNVIDGEADEFIL